MRLFSTPLRPLRSDCGLDKVPPQSEGFERFSIAHELGHYFLDGHIDYVLPKGSQVHTSHAGFVSRDPYELEAGNFAAGLLMPDRPFKRALEKCEPGLATVESMGNLCRTSLTATAIRYAELTDDAVAVVVSTGLTIDYCRLSETMKSLRELTWLRKGSAVPMKTATAQLNRYPDRVERRPSGGRNRHHGLARRCPLG